MKSNTFIYIIIIASLALLVVNIRDYFETQKFSGILSSVLIITSMVFVLIERKKQNNN